MQVCFFFYLSDARKYVIEINGRSSWRDFYVRGTFYLEKTADILRRYHWFPAK